MRLLVLAALAAVASADVSHLPSYQYGVPASSYGVPQNSVTERQFNALPTAPPLGLNLPAFEHQDFALNPFAGSIVSTTAAPFIDASFGSSTAAPSLDTSLLVSSTPAPSVVGGSNLGLSAEFPGFGSGFSFTTPAPSVSPLGFVSSTPAPHVHVTSGSQENLNADLQLPNFNFNSGLNAFTTAAPSLFSSTVAPTISTLAPGFGLGSAYSYPGLGLDGFSTAAPLAFGSGGLLGTSYQGLTSGGSINDAFGVSSLATVSAGTLPQPQQVSKHLYFYAAPDEPEPARTRINVAPVAPPKKNVKVIFIKAPTPPAPPQINIAAPPQDEQKTVVYVLVKKPEDTQNIEIQTPPPTPPSKPEVYFIKYKTQQEAEDAIAKVQSNQEEGSAPVGTINGQLPIGTVNGGGLVGPVVNYVTSTTPAPLLNFGVGGIAGPIQNGGFSFTSTTPAPLLNFGVGGIAGPIQNGGLSLASTTPAPILSYLGGGISGPIGNNGFSFTSTTPAPLLNFGGGISNGGFALSPQLEDNDISQNLISSGGQSSSLFTTGSPLISSLAPVDSSFFGTTTVAPPQVPHATYGPPLLKKK